MNLGTRAIEQDYSYYVNRASDIVFAVVSTATKGPINTPTVCTSPSDFVNKFGPVNTDCLGTYAAYFFLNKSSKMWFVRSASSSASKAQVSIKGEKVSSTVNDGMVFEALQNGTFYNGYKVIITNSADNTSFDMVLKTPSGNTVETKKGLKLNTMETFESNYLKFVSKASDITKLVDKENSVAVEYVLSGGNDGISGIGSQDYITAGEKLASSNIDINLFAVPGVTDPEVITAMIDVAETRADCLYLIDTPNEVDPSEVVAWHNGTGDYDHTKFDSSYAAIYYAWQGIYDSVNDKYIEVPPSVVVAPAIATSASMSEIWYAPAGLKRGLISGVVSPVYTPDMSEVDLLYTGENSINCIVNDPQVGLCIFGQKTLSRTDTALNRVNVRMLLNYLKKIVSAASRHLTFEPNDRVTWNNFEDLIEPTLKSVKNRRGIYDYLIVKGESIVTDEDIDNYRMPCKIMIRPTKAAEEIPIYFTITNTGAEFTDELLSDGISID